MDSRINYCGLGEGSTILFKDRPRVTGAPKLIRPGMHKCFSKTRSKPERRANRHWSHPCKSLEQEETSAKWSRRDCGLAFGKRPPLAIKKHVFHVNEIVGEEAYKSTIRRKEWALTWAKMREKQQNWATCLTHPLTYSPPFQGVKWQTPKGGYLYLLWILVFHSTPFKLEFCSNLIRRNGQGTYKT